MAHAIIATGDCVNFASPLTTDFSCTGNITFDTGITTLRANLTLTGNLVLTGSSTLVVEGDYAVRVGGTLTVGSGRWFTCKPSSTAIIIEAANATINGNIGTNGRGYGATLGPGAGASSWGFGAGGGGHAGAGGVIGGGGGGGSANGGPSTGPITLGSGGGSDTRYGRAGGAGAGAFKLTVPGLLTMNGLLSADGGAGINGSKSGSGGGAGGSIWINAGTLGGSGTINARGGKGGNASWSGKPGSGGGGGGYITLYYETYNFTGTMDAGGGNGGSASGTNGGPGGSGLVTSIQQLADGGGCVSNAICISGNCVDSSCCDPSCEDLCSSCGGGVCSPDPDGGVCGAYPQAAAQCQAGTCTIMSCSPGFGDCDSDRENGCEINTDTDLSSCGACSNVCASGNGTPSCTGGVCSLACDADWAECDTDPVTGCETSITSLTDCGSCNTTCSTPNATPTCATRVCEIATCDAGTGDCDGSAATGCETPTVVNLNACGACGVTCEPRPNALNECIASNCVWTCSGVSGDCNGNGADGCETNTDFSVAHCGGCNMPCSTVNNSPICMFAQCSLACDASWGDCDNTIGTGCEQTLTTISHCGACNVPCNLPNAISNCGTGTCEIGSCIGGYDDCDGIASNGCEAFLAFDPLNCGGCGSICTPPANATSTCINSTCDWACDTDFADCDGDPANGCEVNLTNDAASCGGCGAACASGWLCAQSTCVLDCNPLTLCGGACADLNVDPDNCGVCGNVCGTPANSDRVCSSGACAMVCQPGFADCDVLMPNGCETVLNPQDVGCPNVGALRAVIVTTPVPPMGNAPLSVTLDGSSSISFLRQPISAHTWRFSNGAPVQSGAVVTHDFLRAGGVTVTLEIRDAAGNVAEARETVTVLDNGQAPPNVRIEAVPRTPDVGDPVSFYSVELEGSAPLLGRQWTFEPSVTSTMQAADHIYDSAGTYVARLVVFDENGLEGSDSVLIQVGASGLLSPVTTVTADPTFVDLRSGSSTVRLRCDATDPGGAGLSYLWDLGDGISSTDQAPLHDYAAVGNYTAVCWATDGNGNIGVDLVEISVGNQGVIPPQIVSLASTESICADAAYLYNDSRRAKARGTRDGLLWSTGKIVGGSMVGAPAGYEVDPSTGVVTWTPSEAQVGLQQVVLIVTNTAGVDVQEYEIEVTDCSPDDGGGIPPAPGGCGCTGDRDGGSWAVLLVLLPLLRRRRACRA